MEKRIKSTKRIVRGHELEENVRSYKSKEVVDGHIVEKNEDILPDSISDIEEKNNRDFNNLFSIDADLEAESVSLEAEDDNVSSQGSDYQEVQEDDSFEKNDEGLNISKPVYIQKNKKYSRKGALHLKPTRYQPSETSLKKNILADSTYDLENASVVVVNDLSCLPINNLRQKAVELGMDSDLAYELKKQELVIEILKMYAYQGYVVNSSGTLEILAEGYGFLRSELNSYLSGSEDVFVSPQIIKAYGLKTGDTISCMLRNPKESERFFAVAKIISINGDDPSKIRARIPFDSLVPLYPDSMIKLEGKSGDISMRIIDLFAPIGKGQRALITAPPRTGKTILLQKIANAITANYPEIKLIVLLVDERPEEVTDMRRNVKGEVVASTFDEQAQRHVSVAEMVIEKAKRLVESGNDVVILLDSITRLARAYNQTAPASGKVLSGGVDSNALHKPKRFFGAARNIENGGSLTIIASALIETGSRMDEVIFEEFKGTGNCEIVLDRKIADKRVYPAINLKKSGTRREEFLLDSDKISKIWLLRNVMNSMEDVQMTEWIIDKMKKTDSTDDFLLKMKEDANSFN